jgi:transposase
VARNFLPYETNQQFLMPPSLADWLPEDHLAFFVLDVVSELDLSSFEAHYRRGGAGRAAYDPRMLLALLLYAYCIGERSSRRIERRCSEDVAFRVIAANQAPDHATIARFRADHEDAIEGVFSQALGLCAKAGLIKVGVVAIDGTKVAASASGAANRSADAIGALVERILSEAKATDEAEDEMFGDRRGDELPAEFSRREGRVQRLRELKAELEAEDVRRRAEAEGHEAKRKQIEASGRRSRGAQLRPKDPDRIRKATVNTTDPDSRVMKTPGGFVQGYNAQAVVTEDQIILAAALTQDAGDVRQLQPMIIAAVTEVQAAGLSEPVGTVLADAGYFSERNAAFAAGPELLIAPVAKRKMPEARATEPTPDTRGAFVAANHAEAERRAQIMKRWDRGELHFRAAATALGLSVPQAYVMRGRWRQQGTEGLLSRRTHGRIPRQTEKDRMLAKITEEPGKTLYARRSQVVEPVFGQIKESRAVRRFTRRGLSACASEWKLVTATHNLLKVWRSGWSPSVGRPAVAPA